jgi:hypothetical protein
VEENRELIPNTHDQLEDEEEISIPRANRNRRPPERYGNPFTFKTTQEETVTEPKKYKDAVSSTQAKYWKQAMQAEFESLEDNNTWTLVREPKDRKVLPGKWVYKSSRYIAKGFAQVEGLDFSDTYAPTCKPETFRILLAIAAQKDLHLGQMDVKSAYIHSTIEEEIYLEQPEGFVKQGEN